jgi:hypothetical protein
MTTKPEFIPLGQYRNTPFATGAVGRQEDPIFQPPCRLIRIYVTRLSLTVSDLPIMLKGLWGDSNRNTGCVASVLRILTKKRENGCG